MSNTLPLDALRQFCISTRDVDALQTARRTEKRAARDTKRATEQLLIESLGNCVTRKRFILGGEAFIVSVKLRESRGGVQRSAPKDFLEVWAKHSEELRERLLEAQDGDVCVAAVEALLEFILGPVKEKLLLEVGPMKNVTDEDLDLVDARCLELLQSYMTARSEIKEGQEDHKEKVKELRTVREQSEHALLQELAQMPEGFTKKVQLQDSDGTAQAYYVRTKSQRMPSKRKITLKCLKQNVRALVEDILDPMHLTESLELFCSQQFGEAFAERLEEAFVAFETPSAEEEPRRRLALDRVPVRRPRLDEAEVISAPA